MSCRCPYLVLGKHGVECQAVFFSRNGIGPFQRNTYHLAAQGIHVQVYCSGGDNIVVSGQAPGCLVVGSVQEMVAVPYFHQAFVGIDQRKGQRLRALFQFPHFRLRGTVRPDAAVCPGSYAVGPERTLVGFFLEIKPQSGLGRCKFCGAQRFCEYAHIVYQGVADVHVGILSLSFFAASDAQ